MSADNWGICPRCYKKYNDDKNDLIDKVADARKNKSIDEWEALRKQLDEMEGPQYSLREDYESFVSKEGRFYISYSGVCETCGFSKQLKIDEKLKL